jgi:excisionase family DNA binding protein
MSVVREMSEDLMRECLEDAERIMQERWGGMSSREATATVAAALFEARWAAGVRLLYDATMDPAPASTRLRRQGVGNNEQRDESTLRFLTVRETAKRLRLSASGVRSLIRERRLPARRLRGGRLVRIAVEDVDRLLEPISSVLAEAAD